MKNLMTTPILAGILGAGAAYYPREEDGGGYQFVPDTSLWVTIHYGRTETLSTGHLDGAGNFIPDRKMVNMNSHSGRSFGTKPSRMINGGEMQAHEYRSGRLIKGKINTDGDFVPGAWDAQRDARDGGWPYGASVDEGTVAGRSGILAAHQLGARTRWAVNEAQQAPCAPLFNTARDGITRPLNAKPC
jgi:hypothetical protein